MIPETGEDEEYESSEQYDQEETKDDELTDELAARQEAAELLMSHPKTDTENGFQGSDDGRAWRMGDFKEIQLSQDQRLIDLDSVQNRLFLMISDLTLIELNLLTHEVLSTVRLSEVEGAEDIGSKAVAFVL